MLEPRRDGKSKITLFKKSNKFNNYWSVSQFWPLFWYSSLEQESWLWTDSASWPHFIHVWLYLPAAEKYLRKVTQSVTLSFILLRSCCQLTWLNGANIPATERIFAECWILNASHIGAVISGVLRKLHFYAQASPGEQKALFFGCVCINVSKP